MTAIDKIHKLEEVWGWTALNYCVTGNGTPPRKWWVTWATKDGPSRQEFNTYQAFHAYLNNKLGVRA